MTPARPDGGTAAGTAERDAGRGAAPTIAVSGLNGHPPADAPDDARPDHPPADEERVNILLVDDQPAKLLSYEAILGGLGETLLKATSGREALEHLLKSNVAVVLIDVCMPDLDGFQLAAMIREHPRFQKTAIIFVSAIHLSDPDRLRGYEMGAVDYVPVPVVPEVLRAKVRVFAELYRKTRELERLNAELEKRVLERTAELEMSTEQLRQSERRRSMALIAGNMGSWDWDCAKSDFMWDDGQYRIFGVDRESFVPTPEKLRPQIHPEDWEALRSAFNQLLQGPHSLQCEFRVRRPSGEERWCLGTATSAADASGRIIRVSGVTVDITDRKEAEERQTLLAREIDHRAKNALAVVQSMVRLTRANDVASYVASVEGRINALSRVHTVLAQSRWQAVDLRDLVEEEMAPYRIHGAERVITNGPRILLEPAAAQTLTLALHELVTNAAKYGALSSVSGRVMMNWEQTADLLTVIWTELGGPAVSKPTNSGFGTRIITASIEKQLGGNTAFDWRPEGLRCTFSIPRNREAMPFNRSGNGSRELRNEAVVERGLPIAGNRIMVVEDETLVAMVVAEHLEEMGFSVVGPYSSVSQAMTALKQNNIDAAVLDVNLGGEPVYPLADALMAARVPFVFVTGYGAAALERRFEHIPVLQKPIDGQMLERIMVAPKSGSNIASIKSGRKITERGGRVA
jgi:PAS domain S-box-containing protein